MTKKFTENDFLKLVYNEANEDEIIEMNASIVLNAKIHDIYDKYKYLADKLDDIIIEAPPMVIEKIKDFSRNIQLV